ncbi:hypothetical protein DFJ73DRAFT_639190 [Zopfochytrium polystomum]|nr:hypothetical protein DFJ73DRAFT_639190 [Zopfochytrium polystomum]
MSGVANPGPGLINGTTSTWSVLGCLYDAVNGAPRTLPVGLGAGFSVSTCTDLAAFRGYRYAGLEYGGECWAGNEFHNITIVTAPSGDCTMSCNANPSQICGGGNRLSGYYLASYTLLPTPTTQALDPTPAPPPLNLPTGVSVLGTGCMLDAVGGVPRTFSHAFGTNNSIAACAASAQSAGYTLFGLEYGGECWADSEFRNTTNVDAPGSDCSFPCTADATQTCGAGGRLSTFRIAAGAPPLATSTTAVPATPTSSGSLGTATPTKPLPAGVSVLGTGCMLDAVAGAPRTFSHGFGANFSIESCAAAASAAGYALFGLEYGGECWADAVFRNVTNVDAAPAECSFSCTADAAEVCGAGSRLSTFFVGVAGSGGDVVTATTTAVPPPPTPAALPAGVAVLGTGCMLDAVGEAPRTFSHGLGAGFTLATCAAGAVDLGCTMFGLEYGGECWCDTEFRNTTNVDAPLSDCSFPCTASPAEKCGAGNRLSVFGIVA